MGHTDTVYVVAFSPCGQILVSGGEEGILRLWDPFTGRHLTSTRGHPARINTLSFSYDGKTLATGSSDGTILLWDLDQIFNLQDNR